MTALLAALYLAVVNLLAFALFGIDKRRAAAGEWRVRESTLLWVAAAGGWIGAKAGQRRFRHKTRKQPFAARLDAMGVVAAGLAVIAATLALAPPALRAEAGAWVRQGLARLVAAEEPGAEEPSPLPRRFGPGA